MKVFDYDKSLLRGSNMRKNKWMGTIFNQEKNPVNSVLKSLGLMYCALLDCIIMSPDPHSIFVLYDSLTPG